MNFLVPVLHPSFIGRQNRRFEGVVLKHLTTALALANGQRQEWTEKGNIYNPDVATVESTLKAMQGHRGAYDIETDGKHPLLCDIRCL